MNDERKKIFLGLSYSEISGEVSFSGLGIKKSRPISFGQDFLSHFI